MANNWTILKDGLSLAGGLMVSVPWFLDFSARVDLRKFKNIPSKMRSLQTIVDRHEAWLAAPKLRDLILTSIGLIAVCFSFLVALLQSLTILPS